jgi:hypothetical protein
MYTNPVKKLLASWQYPTIITFYFHIRQSNEDDNMSQRLRKT